MLTSYPEPLVARVIGVKKPRLAGLRRDHLEKGPDWALERQVVCYSFAGLQKLLGVLGTAAEHFTWPEAAAPADAVAPVPETEGQEPGSEPEALKPALNGAAEAKAPEQKLAAEALAGAVEAAVRPLVELEVVGLSRNSLVLFARTPEGDEALVRVRSNENFRAGMKLKARPPGAAGGPWWHEGNCPRYPGHY